MAFSSQLVEAQFRADQVFKSGAAKPSQIPQINALSAIIKETTSLIDPNYSDPEKKRTNRLFWINRRCTEAPENGRPGCDLDYSALNAGSLTYTLNHPTNDGYKNSFREFETSFFQREEVDVQGIIDTEIKLLNGLNADLVTAVADPTNLSNFSGFGFVVDPADNCVVIPPEKWTPRIMSIIKQYHMRLGMKDPFILSGNALWEMLYDVLKDQSMEMNKGNAARVQDYRIYLDWAMDGILEEEKFFLIEKGMWAILNRVDWKNTTPMEIGPMRMAWSKPSTVMPAAIGVGVDGGPVQLKIDRHTQRACVDSTDFVDQNGFVLNAAPVRQPDDDCSDDATVNGGTFSGKFTGAVGFKCGNPADFGS